jgi:hypothetical protein
MAACAAYLVCSALAFGLLLPSVPSDPTASDAPLSTNQAFLLVAGLTTAVMAWLILRSRWRGWPLAGAMIVVFYGVQTFMPQVESLIFQFSPGFARHVPIGIVPRLMAAGLVLACLWIPLAVRVLGRWKADAPAEASSGSPMPWAQEKWRVVLASVAYVVLYFTFGYYVAWRSPAITAYYQGTDPGTFWLSLGNMLRETPWLPLVQALRGLLWTGLGLTVVRAMRGSVVEKALAVGALFSVVMSAGLLLPNPYMPYDVRMIHLVETASSDFLFGCLLVWLFRPKPAG